MRMTTTTYGNIKKNVASNTKVQKVQLQKIQVNQSLLEFLLKENHEMKKENLEMKKMMIDLLVN